MSLAFALFLMSGGYTRLQGGRWSDSRALSCVERFDTFNQYWTTVSSLHQARSGLGVAVLEGMIYVVGGKGTRLCPVLIQESDLISILTTNDLLLIRGKRFNDF